LSVVLWAIRIGFPLPDQSFAFCKMNYAPNVAHFKLTIVAL
jgi:hypothetical protein